MKDLKEFWNQRAKKYGHTGWIDPVIYAFDQQARILSIEKILSSLNFDNSAALDFGTGSGDFAGLLSKYFKRVIAFDISEAVIKIAEQRYKENENIKFYCADNINKIGIGERSLDLILSITVLDHIMDYSELFATVRHCQTILKDTGFFIILESAGNSQKPKSFYKKFTKFSQWLSLFSDRGFLLYAYYQFYDPLECPCESYMSYRAGLGGLKAKIARLLACNFHYRRADSYLKKLAKEHLETKSDFFWQGDQRESPVKIMIFRKLLK